MNFVIVGTNFISDTLLAAANTLNDFNLYGVCSRAVSSGEAFLAKHPQNAQAKIFTSIEQVCQDQNVDAVYIAAPNSLHKQYAVMCLEAGKHVLGEKPSAANSKELASIIATAKKHQRLYMEAMMTTHLPNFARLQQAMVKIGTPRKYIGQYSQYSSRYDKYKNGERPNTFLPEFANGALVDLGIYPLYLLIALWGAPNSVHASGVLLDTGVDGAGDVLLNYADKQAVISYSKISQGDNITEIQGELGRIRIEAVSQLKKVEFIANNGEVEVISQPFDEHFMKYEVEHFMALVKQNILESPVNTHILASNVMSVLDEARKQLGVVYPND
ncbi:MULTISPECIES: Gfo/Idh/MocA family protein [Pseudoalteromonas]|uniref:Gfo/Idh/MocA family protein n=1 Tax=Pseudoalteromonas TaxID=53246 RepID=UPI00040CE0F7|nr:MULTISPECIES: Gfo/Idh/MocA family oxidoreductase [Pseudoalteromonas]MBH0033490.1 Gfo/Idh/MocA family oxidoreductase [Pseudoalteromonas sp. NZS71_1]PKG64730.1 gfo/Idh/MocA family oxidoreductase [Pseudoalteromonas arctica]PKG71837.1 gfo/Idh/MocA family oxidoreductase [Pseudoalteromonas sp. GutCa3]